MLLLISFSPNKSFNFSSCFSNTDFSLTGGGLENFFSCNIFSASSRICFFYKTKLYDILNYRYKHHWPLLQILIRCNMHEIKSSKIFGRFLKMHHLSADYLPVIIVTKVYSIFSYLVIIQLTVMISIEGRMNSEIKDFVVLGISSP